MTTPLTDEEIRKHLARIYLSLEDLADAAQELTACIRDGDINPSTGSEIRNVRAALVAARESLGGLGRP